jgi:hypothetical protein
MLIAAVIEKMIDFYEGNMALQASQWVENAVFFSNYAASG